MSSSKTTTKLKFKSTAGGKKKDDAQVDLEQQFILRMPPGPAVALRRDVESGAMNLKDKLTIEAQPDLRKHFVRYGGQVFSAKLVDLPAVIESLKTTDRKTFYKTADICQMLICLTEDEESPEETDSPKKAKDKDKRYLWNHGVAPPLKNVRKRRFRKTLTKKYQEQPDIEKEVKRLFRMDNEAIDVKWEVVVDDEKPSQGAAATEKVLVQGETNNEEGLKQALLNSSLGLEQDIFGEVSSSEDEDKDINIMDSGEEDPSGRMEAQVGMEELDLDAETNDLQVKLEELTQQLQEIRDRRLMEEMEISVTDNSDVRARLQNTLEKIMQEENEKQQEYEILSSMMSG